MELRNYMDKKLDMWMQSNHMRDIHKKKFRKENLKGENIKSQKKEKMNKQRIENLMKIRMQAMMKEHKQRINLIKMEMFLEVEMLYLRERRSFRLLTKMQMKLMMKN